jgi:hypothetical protein
MRWWPSSRELFAAIELMAVRIARERESELTAQILWLEAPREGLIFG